MCYIGDTHPAPLIQPSMNFFKHFILTLLRDIGVVVMIVTIILALCLILNWLGNLVGILWLTITCVSIVILIVVFCQACDTYKGNPK